MDIKMYLGGCKRQSVIYGTLHSWLRMAQEPSQGRLNLEIINYTGTT